MLRLIISSIFILFHFSIFSQSHEEKISQLKGELRKHEQKIEELSLQIDSVKNIINKEKLKKYEGIGIPSICQGGKMRSDASVYANIIIEIPKGDTIYVLDFLNNGFNYFKVKYKNNLGYLSYNLIESNPDIELLKSNSESKGGINIYGMPIKSSNSGYKQSKSSTKTYHSGPRGGCYYYSNGKKVYVDRSYCK